MRYLGLTIVAVAACTSDESSIESAVQQCSMQTVEGVDVYAGTGTIDWAKVKASGREFAFIKATQGDYNKQSNFATNWNNAAAAGVLRSPYHFFDGTIDGIAQAQWFLDEVTQAGGLQPGDLAPMLDIECPTSSSQSSSQANCEYTGDSGWVATSTLAQRIFDWLDKVQQVTGRTPFIYSYPSWFAAVSFTDPRLATYPLFIATYASCASVPAPWTTAVFWQYSATTAVPGIAAPGDVDRFFGTPDDLVHLTALPDAGVDAGGGDNQGGGCCEAGSTTTAWQGWLGILVGLRLVRRRGRRR